MGWITYWFWTYWIMGWKYRFQFSSKENMLPSLCEFRLFKHKPLLHFQLHELSIFLPQQTFLFHVEGSPKGCMIKNLLISIIINVFLIFSKPHFAKNMFRFCDDFLLRPCFFLKCIFMSIVKVNYFILKSTIDL